jgi:hypothetical protein
MTDRPITRQPQIGTEPITPKLGSRFRLLDRFMDPGTRQELQLVVAFSLIGLLTVLNLMLLFPNLGALIAQYNQF